MEPHVHGTCDLCDQDFPTGIRNGEQTIRWTGRSGLLTEEQAAASIFWVLLAWGRFPVSKAIIPDDISTGAVPRQAFLPV